MPDSFLRWLRVSKIVSSILALYKTPLILFFINLLIGDKMRGWGDSSVEGVLAWQAQGLEFNLQ